VPVTEWDAQAYQRVSALQRWLGEKSLARLPLHGDERVLDVGCGNGAITRALAGRLPGGSVLGVDASHDMIAFAQRTLPASDQNTVAFRIADAAELPFEREFDLVVSFNCLHWVHDQAAALRGIARALKPSGAAHLRFVSQGERRSLEDVIEETRRSEPWAASFGGFRTPFVHPTPEAYRNLVADSGLRGEGLDVQQEAWDFESRAAFSDFARATFVEWTRLLPPDRCDAFIADVLDRYARLGSPAQANVFTFYQLVAELRLA
jgi:trans-aconitate methyltransferase